MIPIERWRHQAIARGVNSDGSHSRIWFGTEWWTITDDPDELFERWLAARPGRTTT